MPRSETTDHKQLRVGHRSERGAVNAVRGLLEAAGLVVDETSGRSDYGRDLTVDLTHDDKITGGVIGIQVKGDKRFVRDGDWELPASAKDLVYWAESSVPIAGALWDPASGEIRWTNLTAHARADDRFAHLPLPPQRGTVRSVVRLPPQRRLDTDTVGAFIDDMTLYLNQNTARSLLALFDEDEDRRRSAIADCWALGRNDSRAFKLLRRALPSLTDAALIDAIVVLSHLASHPDIPWTGFNWVPESIKKDVRSTFRWSPDELVHLVGQVERFGDEHSWERGGLGQCLFHVLVQDDALVDAARAAIDLAVARMDLDAAFRLLVLHQYLADDPRDAVHRVIGAHPELDSHQMTGELVAIVDEWGRADVY